MPAPDDKAPASFSFEWAKQIIDEMPSQPPRETRLLLAKAQIKSALQMLAEFPEGPPTRGIIATLLEAVEHLRAVKP